MTYEYEYLYEDIHLCCICKTYIEKKYCVLFCNGMRFHYHKNCFIKLKNSLVFDK